MNLGRMFGAGGLLSMGLQKGMGWIGDLFKKGDGLSNAERIFLHSKEAQEQITEKGVSPETLLNTFRSIDKYKQPGIMGKLWNGTKTALGLGAVGLGIDAAARGGESIVGGSVREIAEGAKQIDADTDMRGMFTKIGSFFQMLMVLFKNLGPIMQGKVDVAELFRKDGNAQSAAIASQADTNGPAPDGPGAGGPDNDNGGPGLGTAALVAGGAGAAGYAGYRFLKGRNATNAMNDVADDVAGITAADSGKVAARGGKWGRLLGLVGLGTVAGMTLGPSSAEAATPGRVAAEAGSDAAMNGVMGGVTAVTALETTKGAQMLLKNGGAEFLAKEGVELVGKRIPVVGGLVTVGFSAVAAGGYALNGEFGRAAAEMGTGVVEGLVNATGLGLVGGGDAAREGLRATFSAVAGEQYAPDKSGIRSIVEWTTGTGDFAPSTLRPPALA